MKPPLPSWARGDSKSKSTYPIPLLAFGTAIRVHIVQGDLKAVCGALATEERLAMAVTDIGQNTSRPVCWLCITKAEALR